MTTSFEDFYPTLIINCVFNAFSSCMAITLNIITILALRKVSSLPKPLKTLLLSLSVSDLGVGLLVQPLYISLLGIDMQQKTANDALRVFHVTGTIFSYASFFGVTALSADRFLAIHLHLRYQELVTHKRVVAVVISIWMFSAILSLFVFFIQSLVVLGIIVVVCFISTTFFYVKIYLAVRRHKNQLRVLQIQQVANNGADIENFTRLRKSAVGTFYVYLVFLACYLPDFCIVVSDVINSGQRRSTLIIQFSFFTLTMVFLNSSLNPLIYCWKMKQIRHTIKSMLRTIFPCHN